MKINQILVLFGATALFAACSDNGDGPTPPPPPVNDGLIIQASTNALTSNGTDKVNFTVWSDGVDVTSKAEVWSKDTNKQLSAPSFSTDKSGTYTFFAVYNAKISDNEVEVMAISQIPALPEDPKPTETSFVRRVMGLQFTGTNCMYCPYLTYAIDAYKKSADGDKTIFASVHTNAIGPEPMTTPTTNAIYSAYSSGLPSLSFNMNRKVATGITKDLNANVETVRSIANKQLSDSEAKVGISAAAVADVAGKMIVVNAQIKVAEKNTFRIGAWVLENGIEARQTNPENVPGDYNIHEAVVREVCGQQGKNFTGDPLGELEAGATKDYIMTMPIGDDWNLDNCYVVVFVSTPEGTQFYVNNVIECPLGGSKAYEYK